jgi:hypothetical protein
VTVGVGDSMGKSIRTRWFENQAVNHKLLSGPVTTV